MNIETQLRRVRIERGMTVKELADRAGVSFNGLYKIDHGEYATNNANAITVYKLAKALGCSMEDLLDK